MFFFVPNQLQIMSFAVRAENFVEIFIYSLSASYSTAIHIYIDAGRRSFFKWRHATAIVMDGCDDDTSSLTIMHSL